MSNRSDFAHHVRQALLAWDEFDRQLALAALCQHDEFIATRREGQKVRIIARELGDVSTQQARVRVRLRKLIGEFRRDRDQRSHLHVINIKETTQCTTAKTTRTPTTSKARRK